MIQQEQTQHIQDIRNPIPKHVITTLDSVNDHYNKNNDKKIDNPLNIRFDKINNQIILAQTHNLLFLSKYYHHQNSNTLKCKKQYGTYGTSVGQFRYPFGLSIQPVTNHIIVADYNNNRIQALTNPISNSSIEPLFMIGSGYENNAYGSNETGYFNNPIGVCSNPRGHIIVADTCNNRIQLFDSKGTFLRVVESDNKFDCPIDVCYDHQHNTIIVADESNKKISIWDKDMHQHVRNIKTQSNLHNICVDLNGYVYISTWNETIAIYDPTTFNVIQNIGDENNNYKLGSFNHPYGMCVDDDNNLYVCDYRNNRLQIF
jgi:DNA-binding beta-propeller fold protein YncE